MWQILRCVILVVLGQQYKAVVCIYLYIHTVMNTTILQLVAIYNIKLYVVHQHVVQIIVCFSQTMKFATDETSQYDGFTT